MKQLLFILFVLFFTIQPSIGQKPEWLNENYRKNNYPSSVFIVEFIQDNKKTTESVSQAEERLKDLARANIAKSIRITIQSVEQQESENIIKNKKESFYERYNSSILTKSNLNINGIELTTYYSPEKEQVFVLAVLNRYEAIGYHKGLLNNYLSKINGHVEQAKKFTSQSEINKAKEVYKKTFPLFDQIAYSQNLLIALNKKNNAGHKQEEVIQLYNEINLALNELEQGIFIYIEADAALFDEKTNELVQVLKGQLSKNGCSFTSEKEESDWIIVLEGKATEYNTIQGLYFSYVDVVVKLTKTKNQQKVYEDIIKQKGGSSIGYKEAGLKAYRSISQKLTKQIITYF